MKPKYLIAFFVILIGIAYISNYRCDANTSLTKPIYDTTLKKSHLDKSQYIVKNTDSATYIFPLSPDIFVEGILAYKDTSDIFKYYKTKDMEVYVSSDDGGNPEYIELVSHYGRSNVEKGDSLSYRILPGTKGEAELEAFNLWTGKLNVGGFKVGDSISFVQSTLQVNIPKSVRKIIIANPNWDVYDSLRLEHNIPSRDNYFEKGILDMWDYLPIGIKYVIRNDTIYKIVTTNILSDGSYASPFYTDDLYLLY